MTDRYGFRATGVSPTSHPPPTPAGSRRRELTAHVGVSAPVEKSLSARAEMHHDRVGVPDHQYIRYP